MDAQRRARVLAIFQQEAAERLSRVDEQLLRMEQGESDVSGEQLRALFREVHSLKGAAGLLDLGPVVDVLHRLETVMEKLRDHSLTADKIVVEILLRTTDALRNLLNNLDSPKGAASAELVEQLDLLARGQAVVSTAESIADEARPIPAVIHRLAVCDDALFSRKLLVDMAREAGWSIAWEARDGKEAVELYERDRPDLLTLDLTMPAMPGLEALQRVRSLDPAAVVVIVSAVDQRAVVAECIRAGAADFLTKPIDRDRIHRLLHRFQRNRQA